MKVIEEVPKITVSKAMDGVSPSIINPAGNLGFDGVEKNIEDFTINKLFQFF